MPMLLALIAFQSLAFHSPANLQQTPDRTKGIAPMAGGLGKFGKTYTISREGMPVNFTLLSAQYSTATFNANAREAIMVDAHHKLLVIHYSIENPNPTDMYVGSWSLFQAVDSTDQTLPDAGESRRASDQGDLNITIKPSQSIDDIVTYIVVPADATIPKLILKYPPVKTTYKVMRYMLGTAPNVVKPLQAPFSDPADATGSVSLSQVPAAVGTTYPTGFCDLSVDHIALVDGPLGKLTAADGKRFLVVSITATNKAWAGLYCNGAYKIAVKTDDDKVTDFEILKGSHDEGFQGQSLDGGEATSHRIVVQVPKDAKLKSLSLAIDMGNYGITRAFLYDLSAIK